MCGLVGLFSKKGRPVGQQVFSLYKSQHSRGKEGFGYLAISNDWKLLSVNRSKTEAGIKDLIMKDTAPIILFHHRMPTSTKNTIGSTHPIFVSNAELKYDYYFAHNGVITNKVALKKKHEELGYIYTTEFAELHTAKYNDGTSEQIGSTEAVFNDSESLAIELARHIEELNPNVDTYGAAAFWGVALEKGTNQVVSIYYGKNQGRDLKITRNKKYHGFSSETGYDVEAMKLFSYDLGDPQLYEQELPIGVWTVPAKRTVGYGADREPETTSFQYCLPAGEDRRDPENIYSSMSAYDNLENKHYLFSQAIDTGIPLSEFMAFKEYDYVTYVPFKFANKNAGRKPPEGYTGEMDTPPADGYDDKDVPEKTMRLLEEYCEEYCRIESARDRLGEHYSSKKMTQYNYTKADEQLETKLNKLEEKMSVLGVSESLLEEVLDLTRQTQDYEDTYSSPDGVEYIQIS